MTEEASPQVGNSIGQSVPEGWHTLSKAAELVGRSADTLRTWHSDGTYEPSGWKQWGELRVRLYSDDDIVAMRSLAKTIRPGRPPSGDE